MPVFIDGDHDVAKGGTIRQSARAGAYIECWVRDGHRLVQLNYFENEPRPSWWLQRAIQALRVARYWQKTGRWPEPKAGKVIDPKQPKATKLPKTPRTVWEETLHRASRAKVILSRGGGVENIEGLRIAEPCYAVAHDVRDVPDDPYAQAWNAWARAQAYEEGLTHYMGWVCLLDDQRAAFRHHMRPLLRLGQLQGAGLAPDPEPCGLRWAAWWVSKNEWSHRAFDQPLVTYTTRTEGEAAKLGERGTEKWRRYEEIRIYQP